MVLLFFVFVLCGCVENPGIRVNLQQDSIISTIRSAVTYMESFIQNFKLKEIDEHVSSPIGSINLKVSDIHVSYNTFRLSNPPVTFSPNEMTLQDTVWFGVIDGNWAYSTGDGKEELSGSGSFEANSCVDIQTLGVKLLPDPQLPTGMSISFENIQIVVRDLSINIQGGQSWFLGFFKSFMENQIKDAVYTEIYGFIPKQLPVIIEGALGKIINFPFFGMTLDLFIEDVFFNNNNYLSLNSRGRFEYCGLFLNGSASPFPTPSVKNRMLSFTMSEYTANTALYLISYLDLMSFVITESNIPESFQKYIKLNTSWFGWFFVPELSQKFPNKAMQMEIMLSKKFYPLIHFTESSQVFVDVHLDVHFQVIVDNLPQDAFVVDMLFSTNTSISKLWATPDSINIVVQISDKINDFSMKLISSNVGQFKVDALESVVKLILPAGINLADDYLQKNPFSISQQSIPFFRVADPVLDIGSGYLEINSNFTVSFT